MFFDEYTNYLKQYEKNAKRISVPSGIFKWKKEQDDKIIVRSHGNYDLYFNIYGRLVQSIHFDSVDSVKIVYGYDQKGRLTNLIGLLSKNNALRFRSEFKYDRLDRITIESVRTFETLFDKGNVTKCVHTHDGLKRTTIFKETGSPESEKFSIIRLFNEKREVTEEKALRGVELAYWNRREFNEAGDLQKEVSLDDQGVVDGIYEFLPSENGLSMGYSYKSTD